jgi:hypothetical protein
LDEICNWLDEFLSEDFLDELVGSENSSVLSHGSDET